MSPAGRAQSYRFSRDDRLRSRVDYRHAQRSRLRVHTRSFLIILSPRDDERKRLGVTITRKVGNAVRRNRIRRCIREAFRLHRELFPAGFDYVFIVKKDAAIQGTGDVLDELRGAKEKLWRRASEARRGAPSPPPIATR
ncbi:MAG: ribonuclease P protein component [Sandaracinaceae bacterium]|nr:ribonuclease P protein component [Sandaracinaceae bacterium]